MDMGYHFLVVDASATTRAVAKHAIRVTGLSDRTILDAGDAQEAFDLLAMHRVELALIDPQLPDMDGEAMIGRVLTEPSMRGVPVILISATPDLRQIERLKRAGLKGWLRKPFTSDSLRQMATKILEPTHVY